MSMQSFVQQQLSWLSASSACADTACFFRMLQRNQLYPHQLPLESQARLAEAAGAFLNGAGGMFAAAVAGPPRRDPQPQAVPNAYWQPPPPQGSFLSYVQSLEAQARFTRALSGSSLTHTRSLWPFPVIGDIHPLKPLG
jgi:hypothetical protein